MLKNKLYTTTDWESLNDIAKNITDSVCVLSKNDIDSIKELFSQGKIVSKPNRLLGMACDVGTTMYVASVVIVAIHFIKWYYENVSDCTTPEFVIDYYEREGETNIDNADVRKAIYRHFGEVIELLYKYKRNDCCYKYECIPDGCKPGSSTSMSACEELTESACEEKDIVNFPSFSISRFKIYISRLKNLFLCENNVYASIFAPKEVKHGTNLLVQLYLHLLEETENVKLLAKEPDKNAERREYMPLSLKLKKGDKVDVEFNVSGESRLSSDCKSIIWQGSFTKCSFDYFVPNNLDVDELSCEANIFVNGAMIGEMRFLTQIVEVPRNLNPEILSKAFKKIFISYAHKDFDKVKFMAKAYKAQGVDYFFDRDYLKAGDIYPKKIKDYIDTSDLFILCWSQNAAESEYVEKEKLQALSLSKNIDENNGTLTIHPLSIEPRAELPSDMKDDYNFEVI